jgi:hypothetical protein
MSSLRSEKTLKIASSPPALQLQLVGAARGARNCVPFKLNQARETKAPSQMRSLGLKMSEVSLIFGGGGAPARRRPHRGILFGGGQHGAQQEAALRYVSTHMLADPRMPPSRPRDGSAAAPSDLAMEGRPAVVGH